MGQSGGGSWHLRGMNGPRPRCYSSSMDTMLQTARSVACLSALALGTTGCAVVAVADAAVTVVATGVKVTAKAVGAVADAVIPDGDKAKD